jgi:hypothetical protein
MASWIYDGTTLLSIAQAAQPRDNFTVSTYYGIHYTYYGTALLSIAQAAQLRDDFTVASLLDSMDWMGDDMIAEQARLSTLSILT